MAALSSNSSETLELCSYCNQRPKFDNHPYCSKTCAGHAAALCKHCHKRPKFQGYEYCGKTCALLANPKGKGGGRTGSTVQGSFDPIKIAKLVIQHIPQIQAMLQPAAALAAATARAPAPPPQYHSPQDPFADPAGTDLHHPASANNPFLPSAPAHAGADAASQATAGHVVMTNGAVPQVSCAPEQDAQLLAHTRTGDPESADNLECLITGCGEPVQRDARGRKLNDYCSSAHAEMAVTSGYAQPCILCLTMPQSEDDYFCSDACRKESRDKHAY